MAEECYICPSCGSEVRIGGVCPVCPPRKIREKKVQRAPKKSWEVDETHDGLGLPDEDFDYEEFVEREFGGKPHREIGISWYWWLTAAVLLAGFGWLVLGGVL